MAGKDIDFHAQAILEICNKLGWKRDGKGRVQALIDSAAKQRTLSGVKNVCELFYERDILVNPDVEKDLFSGISRVKSYLNQKNGLPNLYIFKGCINLISELKSYYWGSGDTPRKVDDHCLDELRYYLMTRLKNSPVATEKSPVMKEKERLMRGLRRGGKID